MPTFLESEWNKKLDKNFPHRIEINQIINSAGEDNSEKRYYKLGDTDRSDYDGLNESVKELFNGLNKILTTKVKSGIENDYTIWNRLGYPEKTYPKTAGGGLDTQKTLKLVEFLKDEKNKIENFKNDPEPETKPKPSLSSSDLNTLRKGKVYCGPENRNCEQQIQHKKNIASQGGGTRKRRHTKRKKTKRKHQKQKKTKKTRKNKSRRKHR